MAIFLKSTMGRALSSIKRKLVLVAKPCDSKILRSFQACTANASCERLNNTKTSKIFFDSWLKREYTTGSPNDPKSVQELARSNEVPENYVCKLAVDDGRNTDASLQLGEIPIIDFSLLEPSSSEELEKLHSALTTWGCFQAINHGITDAGLDKVHDVAKQFFALPVNEKNKCSREDHGTEGYGNDKILSEHQILDWTDRLTIKVSPQNRQRIRFWPQNPQEFRGVLLDYTDKVHIIIEILLKAMARTLNLEDNCFLDQFGDSVVLARFNCYPSCPRPDLVLGLKPHTDGSAITIILQDKEVEGLQFLRNNRWVRVPIIPQALLVNLGDQIELMSNGVFKSPVHRVVTNSGKERISLAMFCSPDLDKEIKPADELITEATPRLYQNVTNFPKTYFEYFQQGKKAIDALKL